MNDMEFDNENTITSYMISTTISRWQNSSPTTDFFFPLI